MNKALPWNINGVGFDAREAAREAARRQGKSLGEWLHGVIADHANERGIQERDIVGQDRIDAVTSRLERMSARGPSFDRRARDERQVDRQVERHGERTRLGRRDEETFEDLPRRSIQRERGFEGRRPRASSPMIEETEFLLEEAIDAMEHRALRSERRTDDALASLTKMLEKNEARRDRERESVTVLTQKLSDIETRLSQGADESPIKGALARLEARLDTIGRRDTAEAAARDSAGPAGRTSFDKTIETSEPLRRLETKLNAVLDAVAANPVSLGASVSPIALAASSPEPAPRQRRLGEAIAEISGRQRTLDEPGAPLSRHPRHELQAHVRAEDLWRQDVQDPSRQEVQDGSRERHAQEAMRQDRVFVAMQNDIAALTAKMDDMHRALASDRRAEGSVGIDDLHRQIAALAEQLESRERQRPVAHTRDTAFGGFNESTPSPTVDADIRSLEAMVRDLGTKIEAVQAPGAGDRAIEALEQQIGMLATRFERSEEGLASMATLQHSMRDLFARLEETRANAESSAAKAAHDAIRNAALDGLVRLDDADGIALKKQEHADARAQATLAAVHETLEKVVNRLSTMEGDIAEVRARPRVTIAERAPAPETARPQAPRAEPRPARTFQEPQETRPTAGMMLGAPDPMLGRLSADRGKKATATRGTPTDLDDEAGRADFIAAARRAAQVAQSDASAMATKRAEADGSETEIRASLVEKSKDYVATHKRPVLLGLAAIFVVIGTMAVMQRMGFDDGATEMADYAAPATIVRSADIQPLKARPAAKMAANMPSPASAQTEMSQALAASALPKMPSYGAPIPGSDPIQTGSIPSLPAFAAQEASRSVVTPQSTIPVGLQTMAEAGNGAAEFELAARYADGKTVPRDLKLAASWYEKAASQGLAPAQYRLASLYEKGLGVPQDKAKAKSLYLKAADAGNPRAMHNLAVLLADGNGKPDYEGAATWFRKAAQYGIHDSQYNLAILLARGLGVQQSLVQSYQWFAIAAGQNDSDAAAKRDEVAAKLGASDLAVAKSLAASFHPRGATLAATEVQPPPGGWDGASSASPLNSARPKISSL